MNEKLLSKALISICYLLMCFIFIPYTLHMFITVKDLETRIMMCGPLNFAIMVMSKYSFLIARKNYIRECINNISLDWRRSNTKEDREIMLTYAKHGRFISSLCAMFMYAGGFFYYTARPILASKALSTVNVSVRVLPHPIYSGLFSAETSPSYEIVFFFQWLSECVRYSTNVAACSLGLGFVLHVCGQLEIVVGKLENFICPSDTRYEVKRKIAEINELHLRSMRFIAHIQLILSEVCFVEFCGCTINMCVLTYYTLVELEKDHVEPAAILAYVILFISFTFNIFIFCYIGEILSQQGQKVGVTAYMINWYNLQKQDALGLILLLAVSNRPNTITAGKMTELSYRNFCAVSKFIATLVISGIFYHTIAPLARGTILTANNVSIRPLPHPGFIVVETSPLYEIFFIAQWFSDFVRYSVGGAMCSLGVTFVLHICGQLKIIMSRLEEFIDADTLAVTNMKKKPEILCQVPELTEQSKSDIEYSIEMNRWFLQPIGLWPVELNASKVKKILSELLIMICTLLLCFIFIPTMFHMIISEKGFKRKLTLIGPMSFSVMVMSKYYFLVMRRGKMRQCLDDINIDWRRLRRDNDRKIMVTHARHSRFITTLCAIFMYGGGLFYQTIAPLSRGKILTANNISIRPLPYPVYSGLFVADHSPYYEIVFIAQWFSDFVRYSISVATCSSGAILALHACGQLNIIMSRLETLVDETDSPFELKLKIAELIELHLRSINFIIRIEEILNEVCLVEFLGCTLNICLLGYYILAELDKEHPRAIEILTYSVLFISFTFNIFIFCYIGEKLSQQRQMVGFVAYMIDWYKLSAKNAKLLILVLSMSNYPINITAGKIAELSYRSFCSILRTSLAYLNLLRTLVI
ncbi:uncharacterized protein [Chelonus insularis]|uniref:uncharacterized protein n=1 Tax=Chelonus insularis TaxID=460826 RepID=UPI00158F1BD2|nr:uncharacterized protein LOC118070203 [Chelonus insularis]